MPPPSQSRAVTAMVWLFGIAVFLCYVDRGTLGIAAPLLKSELHLTASQYGLAASAFFWVYAPCQLLAGWLVGRFGAAWVLAGGLLLWGLATALTGLVAGLASLVVLRLVLGLGEAATFPAIFRLIVDHLDETRRGVGNASLSLGVALGPAFGTLAGGLLLASLGWRSLFVIVGLVTLVWLLPWWRTVRRLPPAHPPGTARPAEPTYLQLLANRAVLAMSLAQVCWAFGLYFLVTWLPLWLVEVRGYSLADMAWIGSLAFAAQALAAWSGGLVNDALVVRGLAPAAVRRAGATLGMAMVALGISGMALTTGQPALIASLMTAGFGIGVTHVCLNLIGQLFAGSAGAGKWVGIVNGFGNLSGIVNPLVTGAIIDATGSYNAAFIVAAIVPLVGIFSLVVLVPRPAPIDWRLRSAVPAPG